ncbi:MotA/TolQ/ExbB proton channel family protein [bacterium]|nr:MotA/TolQ/ExbB proton channel family protein [bacterium]
MTFAKFFQQFSFEQPGAPFMYLLALIFLFVIVITVERGYYVMLRSNINAPKFMNEIRRLVHAGDFKKALALCRSAKTKALPSVFGRALEAAAEKEIVDFRTVQNAVDESTLEIIPKLSSRTNYLAMLANISVLIGLMGTIFGLIISFEAAGTDAAALGRGVSTAMYTTFGGLVCAIPSIIFYSIINTKTNAIIDDIDEYSVKLIHLLTESK